MSEGVDLSTWTLPFGKHQGERIADVSADYLRFMVQKRTMFWNYARDELRRRGEA